MKARNHLQYPFTVSIATFACLLACSSEDSRPATPKPAADAATDAATQNDAQSGTDSGSAADAGTTNDGAAPPPAGDLDNAGRAYFEAAAVADGDRAAYNMWARYGGDPSMAQTVSARLHALDMTDGTEDWHLFEVATNAPAGDAGGDAGAPLMEHPLAAWALYDALLVDPNKPFSPTSFLAVETGNGSHNSCGGRWFDENAADKMASYLVSANRSSISVVRQPTPAPAPTNTSFPYLQP